MLTIVELCQLALNPGSFSCSAVTQLGSCLVSDSGGVCIGSISVTVLWDVMPELFKVCQECSAVQTGLDLKLKI